MACYDFEYAIQMLRQAIDYAEIEHNFGPLHKWVNEVEQSAHEAQAVKARLNAPASQEFLLGNRDPNGPANGIFRQLEQIREDLKLTADTGTVVIMPSGDVPWQYIVDVYNQAVRAKFKKIGFAPQ